MKSVPGYDGLAAGLIEAARREHLYYPESLLRGIEAALALPRRFLVFYGPPGVGKSRLVQTIAGALSAELRAVPVGPDWRADRDLLERGGLAPLVQEAAARPDVFFAFCLEEIALGEPEGYLAALLAAMEADPPRLFAGEGRELPLPENLLFFATLCLDSRTGRAGALPRQLLDRSLLFELGPANLQGFLAVWDRPFPGRDPLVEIFGLLQSHGIDLGYRVFREIGQVLAGAARVGLTPDTLLDQQMKARLLPAISGDAAAVEECLRDLVKLLSQEEVRFPETLDKAVRMLEQLGLRGYTAAYLS